MCAVGLGGGGRRLAQRDGAAAGEEHADRLGSGGGKSCAAFLRAKALGVGRVGEIACLIEHRRHVGRFQHDKGRRLHGRCAEGESALPFTQDKIGKFAPCSELYPVLRISPVLVGR